jgi:hypothetical protein
MFEKWRIKPHMEVTDAAGRHVGTVDSIDGDRIKLTRADSADGQHHFIDLADVDRIDDDRVSLKEGTVLNVPGQTVPQAAAADGRAADAMSSARASDAANATGSAGIASPPGSDFPLFGTSGHGTGMGGSGTV